MAGKGSGSRVVCIVAALALVFGLVPMPAFAAAAESTAGEQRSDEEIEATATTLLNAGDYAEGEAIVCSHPETAASSGGLSAQSANGGSLLGGAEVLSIVTEWQYAEATGVEAVPGDSGAESKGLLSAQSVRWASRVTAW